MAASPGDGDRERTDRGPLVDHDENGSGSGELVEHLPQPGLRKIGRHRLTNPRAVRVRAVKPTAVRKSTYVCSSSGRA
jgi:hypothetical protein